MELKRKKDFNDLNELFHDDQRISEYFPKLNFLPNGKIKNVGK